MPKQPDSKPGMLFIDRYMPGAGAEEREAAYQNVRQLIAVLVRINERLRRDTDSPKSDSCDRFKIGDKPNV